MGISHSNPDQLPSGRWRYRYNGRSLGTWPTWAEACTEGEKLEREIRAGTITVDDVRATVKTLVERWLLTKKKLGPRTLKKYLYDLNHYTLPRLGHLTARDVTDDTLNGFVRELEDLGYAGNTIYAACAPLKGAFTWAVKTGRLSKNPFDLVEMPAKTRRQKVVTVDEVHMLASKAPRYGDTILAVYYLLLRVSELYALKVGDVHLDAPNGGGVAHYIHIIGKGRKLRVVGIPPELLPVIRRHVKGALPTAPLFRTVKGKRLEESNWRTHCWYPAVEACGLGDVTPHDIRRSAATHLMAGGKVTLDTARELLGHADYATLRTYVVTPEANVLAAADAFGPVTAKENQA